MAKCNCGEKFREDGRHMPDCPTRLAFEVPSTKVRLYIMFPIGKEGKRVTAPIPGMPEAEPMITDDKEVFDRYVQKLRSERATNMYYDLKLFTFEAEPYVIEK